MQRVVQSDWLKQCFDRKARTVSRRHKVTLIITGPDWLPPLGGSSIRDVLRLALREAWLRFFGADYTLTEVTVEEQN